MTDYSELVKKLRDLHRDPRPASAEWLFENQVALYDAADAIEALQAEIRESMQRCAECGDELAHQMPKRGEWIIDGAYTYNLRELNGKAYEPVYRCSCCNRQTESYLRLDEPKMPEDADFPEYCPHCGAKMEVQE